MFRGAHDISNFSPANSNKENSQLKVRKVTVGNQLSHRSDTEPAEQVDISHKIMNEILNTPSELGYNELEGLNRAIQENSQLMKEKIQQLLGDNQSLKKHEVHQNSLRMMEGWKERSQSLMMDRQTLESKLSGVQDQGLQLDNEEREICTMQQQLDKHQNSMYDYYEEEFSHFKENYDQLSNTVEEATDTRFSQTVIYSAMLESKAMLKEDLNGKLLQRAELVAQKEEQEELTDHFSSQDNRFFQNVHSIAQLLTLLEDIKKRTEQIEAQLIDLQVQSEHCKQQLGRHNQLKQLEAQLVQFCCKNKSQKTKLISIQKSLNLTHPDTLFSDFYNRCSGDLQRLPQFIQNLRASMLRQSGHKWSSANEYFVLLEQYIATQMQNKLLSNQINEIKQKLQSDHQKEQDQICRHEYNQSLLKKELNELMENRMCAEEDLSAQEKDFNQMTQDMTNEAFSHYVSQNYEQLQAIQNQYGDEEYQIMLSDNQAQFQEIISEQQTKRFQNLLKLIQSFCYLEKVIDLNIQAVDECILPDLKLTLSSLEALRRQLSQSEQAETQSIKRMSEVEQAIHGLEQDFRKKIVEFQNRDDQLQQRLKEIVSEKTQNAQQIDIFKLQLGQMIQEQSDYEKHLSDADNSLHREGFYQKSKLEQEIVDLNAQLMNQQQLKRRMEAMINTGSMATSFLQTPAQQQSPRVSQTQLITRRNSGIKENLIKFNTGNLLKDNKQTLSRSMNSYSNQRANAKKLINNQQQSNLNSVPSTNTHTPGKLSNLIQGKVVNSQNKNNQGYNFADNFD